MNSSARETATQMYREAGQSAAVVRAQLGANAELMDRLGERLRDDEVGTQGQVRPVRGDGAHAEHGGIRLVLDGVVQPRHRQVRPNHGFVPRGALGSTSRRAI